MRDEDKAVEAVVNNTTLYDVVNPETGDIHAEGVTLEESKAFHRRINKGTLILREVH